MEASIVVAEGPGEGAESAAAILGSAGAEVTVVHEGAGALAALRAGSPDLVVAEVRWPTGSGFGILEAARRIHPRTPVILFTSQPSVGEAVRAMQEGAETYISRPLGTELVRAARQALERR